MNHFREESMRYWNTDGWEVIKTFPIGYKMHGSCLNVYGPKNYKQVINYRTERGELVSELELTQGQYALIDTEDLDFVCSMNWCASKSNGVFKRAMSKRTLLHQLISEKYYEGSLLDHINIEYPLSYEFDNRKCNLRPITLSGNNKNIPRLKVNNSSGHTGIFRNSHDTCWSLRIRHKKKDVISLHFPDKEYQDPLSEAIQVRDLIKPWLILEDFNKELCTDHLCPRTREKLESCIDKLRGEE